MTDDVIVPVSVVIDTVLQALEHQTHRLAHLSDAEVLTVAVVAARSCQHHHARAVPVRHGMGCLSGTLSTSRFKRRVHALGAWLRLLLEPLGALLAQGAAFLVDRMPVPVCRRARARRCRTVRGAEDCGYCGYCAAKREQSFGGRLPLVCTAAGVPVACARRPASLHDLPPRHELLFGLPAGASASGDTADHSRRDEATILAETRVRLVPLRQANLRPNRWADKLALRASRQASATVNSQLAALGGPRLHARTTAGRALNVEAALLALACATAH
jgi:hypothetical protein